MTSKTWHYTIPGTPVTKKNHQSIIRAGGRPIIIQSKAYLEYEGICSYYLKDAPRDPLPGPVTVRCVYYMPTRRRVDLCNLMAATHDILVRWHILADDNRDVIASTDGSRVYYSKDYPRVEITIEPFTEPYTPFKTESRKKGR